VMKMHGYFCILKKDLHYSKINFFPLWFYDDYWLENCMATYNLRKLRNKLEIYLFIFLLLQLFLQFEFFIMIFSPMTVHRNRVK
jgi:hypothetical protein